MTVRTVCHPLMSFSTHFRNTSKDWSYFKVRSCLLFYSSTTTVFRLTTLMTESESFRHSVFNTPSFWGKPCQYKPRLSPFCINLNNSTSLLPRPKKTDPFWFLSPHSYFPASPSFHPSFRSETSVLPRDLPKLVTNKNTPSDKTKNSFLCPSVTSQSHHLL